MTVMADLAALQAVDSELDRVRRQAADLQARLADDGVLRERRTVRDAVAASLQQYQLAQRRYEGESAAERLEIQKREARLNSPDIRDMHSYEATQSEIEKHTARLRELEDSLVAAMEDVEVTTQRLQELHAELTVAERERKEQIAGWRNDLRALQTEATALHEERTRRLEPLPQTARDTYSRLRQQKAGRGIATVQSNSCGVCRVAIPPTTLSKARSGMTFVPCDNCGRLLYVPR